MPDMPMKQGGYSPKPETEVHKDQVIATGGYDKDLVDHTKVEDEAAAHGVSLTPIGGHGQGGAGH